VFHVLGAARLGRVGGGGVRAPVAVEVRRPCSRGCEAPDVWRRWIWEIRCVISESGYLLLELSIPRLF
jgi:hypothetical protein